MAVRECSICARAAKYRCPKCHHRTCSLACSQKHKLANDCDGKVDVTAYVPRNQLLQHGDNLINRDYSFLSGIQRDLESTGQQAPRRQNRSDYKLKKALGQSGANVELLPRGMKRAMENKTMWNAKKKIILWTIEWHLVDDEKRFLDPRVSAAETLEEASRRHVDVTDLHFFLPSVHTPAKYPSAVKLDRNATIEKNLQGRCFIEYPTILLARQLKGWEIEEDRMSTNTTGQSLMAKDTETMEESSDGDSASDAGDDLILSIASSKKANC